MNDIEARAVRDKCISDIRKWTNHTKEGYQRAKKDLRYFDTLWKYLSSIIYSLEKKSETQELDEYEQDFIKMVKYVGPLYRIHLKYKCKDKNYGIKETEHYLSWTKNPKCTNIYWVHSGVKYLIITANATPEVFGINLVGLSDFLRKHEVECGGFLFGAPSLNTEEEVVFPLKMDFVTKLELKKL